MNMSIFTHLQPGFRRGVDEMTESGIRTQFGTIMSCVMARIMSSGFTPDVNTKLSKSCKVNKCDILPYRSLLHSVP